MRVPTSRDVDDLYQRPLAEFTAARNALAKSSRGDAAAIRAFEKPSVPAWAVNQLYWKHRRTYDRLTRASERLRAAHAQRLKGRKVDVATFESQHAAAVKDASETVRAILAAAGDPATLSTLKAVIDTLQALPGGAEPGRLTKALAPIGFAALGTLMKGAASSRALAEVVTFAPPKPTPDDAAATARRIEQANRARLIALERAVRSLNAKLAGARARLERAEAVKADAEARFQKATGEATRRRAEVARLESSARAADQERARLAADLRD